MVLHVIQEKKAVFIECYNIATNEMFTEYMIMEG